MRFRRVATLTVAFLVVTPLASAETETACTGGNCVYRFDDGDVNAPGWSPYMEFIKLRKAAPKAILIRPRVSFVMELVKSTDGVW